MITAEINTNAQCLFRKCNQERDLSCLACRRLYSSRWSALAFSIPLQGDFAREQIYKLRIALKQIYELRIALEKLYKLQIVLEQIYE